MAYCVMNIQKQGRTAIYGLQIEANRKGGEGREFPRSNIDMERTGENIFLRETENWNKEISRQIKLAGVKERKDSRVAITGVYTASPEWFTGKSKEEIIKYFEDCLSFHDREYGRAFNAVIHMDEQTPHMQVISVPIVEDEKGKHLSAKIIMGNRVKYQDRQDRFYKEVGQLHGLERGERRDAAERKKRLETRDWQEKQQAERLAIQDEKLKVQSEKLESTRVDLDAAQKDLELTMEKLNFLIDKVEKQLEIKKYGRLGQLFLKENEVIEVDKKSYDALMKTSSLIKKELDEYVKSVVNLENERKMACMMRDTYEMKLNKLKKDKESHDEIVKMQAMTLANRIQERVLSKEEDLNALLEKTQREKDFLEKARANLRDLVNRKAIEVAKGIIKREENDLTMRMRNYMETLRFNDGSSALEDFEKIEAERMESIEKEIENHDYDYSDIEDYER